MKLIFFGSSSFSIPILETLHKSKHTVQVVISTPPVKKGRGLKVLPSAVETWARERQISVLTPANLKAPEFLNQIAELGPDCLIVASYGKMLPRELLAVAKKLPFNIHPSLLPKYRGAAPIARQILDGEKETGVTIAKITSQLDAGEIIKQEKMIVEDNDNAEILEEKLASLGSRLILEVLNSVSEEKIKLIPQDESKASYAHKLDKNMGQINWTKSANEILQQIRGLNPWPSAYTFFQNKRIKILDAQQSKSPSKEFPGTIVSIDAKEGIRVQTGSGLIHIKLLKTDSGNTITAQEFQNGYHVKSGDRFS